MIRGAVQTAFLFVVVLLVGTAAAIPALGAEPLFMWQVESESATVTMVGSIHVGKPEFFPLSDIFESAFASAGVLAVEVDIGNPANVQKTMTLMTQKGILPKGETLEGRLGEDVWKRLEEFAAQREINLMMYSRFKPGIVAMILVMEEYKRQGFDPELGIDKHFLDAARDDGKAIRELETVEDQMDLFFAIDDQLDDILIMEMLDQMDDLGAMAEEMVGLWKSGDVDGLDAMLQEQIGEDPEMVDFYRTLLDDRNVKMTEKIDAWLKEDTDVFVVVGAGHFSGEMGVVKLLEGKGWKVEQAKQ